MNLSPHFTLAELTKSAVAIRKGIANVPNKVEIAALRKLAWEVLEPIREEYQIPFTPSSGFRSPRLNRAIKGARRSQHMKGEAADIELVGIANPALAKWIAAELNFDQVILEFYTPGEPSSGWVHVSYRAGENRRMLLTKTYGRPYRKGFIV